MTSDVDVGARRRQARLKRRGIFNGSVIVVGMVVAAFTLPEPTFKSVVAVGAGAFGIVAFPVIGVRFWLVDVTRHYSPEQRRYRDAEGGCSKDLDAAMLPFSLVVASLFIFVVSSLYGWTLGATAGTILGVVVLAGSVLALTIGKWRRPRFLASAEARAGATAERR